MELAASDIHARVEVGVLVRSCCSARRRSAPTVAKPTHQAQVSQPDDLKQTFLVPPLAPKHAVDKINEALSDERDRCCCQALQQHTGQASRGGTRQGHAARRAGTGWRRP